MLNGSDHPPGSHTTRRSGESSLIDLGTDRAVEVLSGILDRAFPVTDEEPDAHMRRLLRALADKQLTANG